MDRLGARRGAPVRPRRVRRARDRLADRLGMGLGPTRPGVGRSRRRQPRPERDAGPRRSAPAPRLRRALHGRDDVHERGDALPLRRGSHCSSVPAVRALRRVRAGRLLHRPERCGAVDGTAHRARRRNVVDPGLSRCDGLVVRADVQRLGCGVPGQVAFDPEGTVAPLRRSVGRNLGRFQDRRRLLHRRGLAVSPFRPRREAKGQAVALPRLGLLGCFGARGRPSRIRARQSARLSRGRQPRAPGRGGRCRSGRRTDATAFNWIGRHVGERAVPEPVRLPRRRRDPTRRAAGPLRRSRRDRRLRRGCVRVAAVASGARLLADTAAGSDRRCASARCRVGRPKSRFSWIASRRRPRAGGRRGRIARRCRHRPNGLLRRSG